MKVQRWDINKAQEWMQERAEGEYVLYQSYDSLTKTFESCNRARQAAEEELLGIHSITQCIAEADHHPQDDDTATVTGVRNLLWLYQCALERVTELEDFVRSIRDNFDCDSDQHKYNNGFLCRCCDARRLLPEALEEK